MFSVGAVSMVTDGIIGSVVVLVGGVHRSDVLIDPVAMGTCCVVLIGSCLEVVGGRLV